MRAFPATPKSHTIFTILVFIMLIGICFAASPPGAFCLGHPTTIAQEDPNVAYCTADDIKDAINERALIQLTYETGAGVVDVAQLNKAIKRGAEEIDPYIGAKCKLPLSGTIPPILKTINVDLAIYNLYQDTKEEIPQTRIDQRKNAIGLLTAIRDGKLSIGLQPSPDPPAAGQYANGSRVSARTKDFDSDTMAKY